MFGLTHKDDKKKLLARDYWGRVVLFATYQEAHDYLQQRTEMPYNDKNSFSDWSIKETKMKKPKNPGDEWCI